MSTRKNRTVEGRQPGSQRTNESSTPRTIERERPTMVRDTLHADRPSNEKRAIYNSIHYCI